MPKYTLICKNESQMDTQFCVFQRFKSEAEAVSLAWLCQSCATHAATRFSWSDDLYFIWGFAQDLLPKSNLFTVQAQPVREAENLRLRQRSGLFSFSPMEPAEASDTLLVSTDATVPPGTAAVGLGMQAECMCGTAVLAVCAGPNTTYCFDRQTEYYLTAAPSRGLQVGDVLSLDTLNAIKLPFSSFRAQITATLNESNQFSLAMPMFRSGKL